MNRSIFPWTINSPRGTPDFPNSYTVLADPRLYRKIYLRVQNAYPHWNDATRARFFDEVASSLTRVGFSMTRPDSGHSAPTADRGAESLYLHPQHFSGWLVEAGVPDLATQLNHATKFELRAIDGYERAYNYTADEINKALAACRDSVRDRVLLCFRTPRRNLYRSHSALSSCATPVGFFRGGIVVSTLEQEERRFIQGVFQTLVEEGQILNRTRDGETLYRTRTARDL